MNKFNKEQKEIINIGLHFNLNIFPFAKPELIIFKWHL